MTFNDAEFRAKYKSIELTKVHEMAVYELQGLNTDVSLLDDLKNDFNLGGGTSYLCLDTSTMYVFSGISKSWYQL